MPGGKGPKRAHRPHKLDLYRFAVQHPEAEVDFLRRCFVHYRGTLPTRFKEDFAGTAAVAAHWVSLDDDMRAVAVDSNRTTLRHARRVADGTLGHRVQDLHLQCADVLEVTSPRVHVVAALNFSSFVYHDRASLLRYFRSARKSLLPDGLLILDAYDGPGALRTGEQKCIVRPPADVGLQHFTYHWDQRAYDAVSSRVDCRIHFTLSDGERIENAFRYDWRLWSLTELLDLMHQGGFARAEVWCDLPRTTHGRGGWSYRPVRKLPAREDWVAYVAGVK